VFRYRNGVLEPGGIDAAAGKVSTETPRSPRYAVVLGAVVTAMLMWASGFVIVRYIRPYYGAGEVVLARFGGAALLLLPLIVRERPAVPARRDVGAIVIVGLTWFGLNNFMLNAGEKLIDAGTAAMLANVAPVFVAIVAVLALREKLGRALIAGLIIAFAGAIVIGWSSGHHHGGLGGAALCFFAAVPYTIAVVVQKPVLERVSATVVTWGGFVVATLVFLPFAPDLVHEVGRAPAKDTLLLAFAVIGPTAIAFTAWAFALTHSSLAAQTVSTYLVPVLAVLIGWAALAEAPTALVVVGGVLCLAGVAVAQRGQGLAGADRGAR
jgi:drug/metabolite transporter (DMT)-like permease